MIRGKAIRNCASWLALFIAGAASIADADQTALVIIDMQEYFITRGGNQNTKENQDKVAKLKKAQLQAIQVAIKSGAPILFVEYEGERYGGTDPNLVAATKGYNLVTTLKKSSDDMFGSAEALQRQVDQYLTDHEVTTLVMLGANGGACVRSSIFGALGKNYNVVAMDEGIADFNYPDYIYPYEKYYGDIKPTCETCHFFEVSNVLEASVFFSGSMAGWPAPIVASADPLNSSFDEKRAADSYQVPAYSSYPTTSSYPSPTRVLPPSCNPIPSDAEVPQ